MNEDEASSSCLPTPRFDATVFGHDRSRREWRASTETFERLRRNTGMARRQTTFHRISVCEALRSSSHLELGLGTVAMPGRDIQPRSEDCR